MCDVSVGMRAALNASVQRKHLNHLSPDFGSGGAAELVEALDGHFVRYALQEWNRAAWARQGFHVAEVVETHQLWGAKRSGVVVRVAVEDEDMQRRMHCGPVIELIVPTSMLTDMDEALIERERHLLEMERLGDDLRRRVDRIRARKAQS